MDLDLTSTPSTSHWMEAGGLELPDLQVSFTVSPTLACFFPLMVTLSGATEERKNIFVYYT